MSEYNRPKNEQEFEKNFAQKKPLMSKSEAYLESSRCLFCYDAPCMNACPTHIDIPLFIKQINTGNVEGAARTIFDANWFGNACGKVCPTGVLCEGSCVYEMQHVKPIDIGRLQTYATNQVIREGKKLFSPGKSNGRKIAVIGAGPAGIACACELRVLGYEVDIFEAKNQPSGLTVHGVAPYKISNEDVLDEMKWLQDQLGFRIHYGQAITTREQLDKIEKEYEAVFVGVGLGATAQLGIPGEDKQNVVGAVEFIELVRANHHNTSVPDRVVVLGGGNTAMDAASASARLGAKQVYLAYRRPKEEMGAYHFEYQLAIGAGVDSLFEVTPKEILGNGKVEGLKFARTRNNGGKLEEVPGSEFVVECDLVIKATGQAKQGNFFSLIPGLEVDKSRRVVVDPQTFQSKNPRYFAGGDAINGGAEVVNGAYDGKMAAHGIHAFLNPQS